ncbi:hypothetical protein M406DRAFT_67201 [Cryphonectria parasitica EP155]|uniref:Uncharacterized protein n=1 Tax=Cryphonectria parasitica (strain ATCC 38755 / EP155) TaxID=660469 RepID=A0A9P4YDE3_CRYP1|nr:uncharacterized protein M406DRAFT_67201 [Cryphonectria parasitica EP155]KAF3770832.1 hypothetical protein M406DRAFT_67201 [Cryphonectria parasitica EP155]
MHAREIQELGIQCMIISLHRLWVIKLFMMLMVCLLFNIYHEMCTLHAYHRITYIGHTSYFFSSSTVPRPLSRRTQKLNEQDHLQTKTPRPVGGPHVACSRLTIRPTTTAAWGF